MRASFMGVESKGVAADLGILLLRLTAGGFMFFGHGWGKLVNFNARIAHFPDPLGIGNPSSLALAVFAEAFCSLAVVLGLFTRFTLLPLIVTMGVAAFIFHTGDPFGKKELALLYLSAYTGLFLTGPGAYSLDAAIFKD